MSKDNLNIGKIITTAPSRDAIHMAVTPVMAAEEMAPGWHVGLVPGDISRATAKSPHIGVVDPFLRGRVKKGERFWLFLYPQTVTGLRHEWSHPAFIETPKTEPVSQKSASEIWMRAWAAEHMGSDYYGDYDAKLDPDVSYNKAIEAGYECHIGPYESARDHIDNEWWAHWEIITGQPGKRGEYFSCGC